MRSVDHLQNRIINQKYLMCVCAFFSSFCCVLIYLLIFSHFIRQIISNGLLPFPWLFHIHTLSQCDLVFSNPRKTLAGACEWAIKYIFFRVYISCTIFQMIPFIWIVYIFFIQFFLSLSICIYISSSYYLFFSSFWSDYFVYKRFVLSELASWVFARWRYVLNSLTGNDLFSTVRNELNADHKIDGNKTRCGHLTWPNEILWLQTNGVFSFQFVYQFTMQPIFCGWTLNSWSKHLRIESKDSYGIMMRRVKKRIEMPIRSAIHTIRTQHAAETIKYCSD